METEDYLYSNPQLYEKAFPARSKGELCISLFEKYRPQQLTSILDVGCGTGRDLAEFAKVYPHCTGFDITPAMVDVASERNPNLEVSVGDMRTHRLGRTFDGVCALGGSINFALSNRELEQTIETYRVHSHPGTLLVIQPINPASFFGQLDVPQSFSVEHDGTTATGAATYSLSPLEQIVERRRVWTVDDGSESFEDSLRYRITFPAELAYFLSRNGFEVVEMFDAPGGPLYTKAFYVVARCVRDAT